MSDPSNTSGNPESATGGDKGQSPTGGGNPSGTGAPSSDGITLDQLQRVLAEAQAPLLAKIEALENRDGARRRVSSKKQDSNPPATSDGDDTASDDFESMSKDQLARELRSLKEAEQARQAREQQDLVSNALQSEISKGSFANADLLSQLIAPNLRLGASGGVIHDDGKKVTPLADIVRELGARDIFQKPSKGGGSGAGDEGQPVNGLQYGQKTLQGDDIAALPDDEFNSLLSSVIRNKDVT